MLTPIARPYKGESQILVRASIDATKKLGCQLYDDAGRNIDETTVITTEHNIIPLVYLEGIKFSSKSIDIVITLSQLMVFSPEKKKSNECLINHKLVSGEKIPPQTEHITVTNSQIKEQIIVNRTDKLSNSSSSSLDKEINQDFFKSVLEEVNIPGFGDVNLGEISELPDHEYNPIGLQEVDITDKIEERSIILKNPTEVYYEIYRVAKERAILTKQVAVEAYLEAKQIKTKFNIVEHDE